MGVKKEKKKAKKAKREAKKDAKKAKREAKKENKVAKKMKKEKKETAPTTASIPAPRPTTTRWRRPSGLWSSLPSLRTSSSTRLRRRLSWVRASSLSQTRCPTR